MVRSEGLELKRDMYSFFGPQEHLWIGAARGGIKHVLFKSWNKSGYDRVNRRHTI